jgi:superfamily II DNA or RNA helicase
MNQWIERIKEFLPNASIGKIQGQNISISADIVIGMLQSLSMKDYDESIFDSFGFIIIDEVHHMGAEVFSQALLKVNTNYCLGLSATMNRKDGLTKVFKMFLGDIVHTEKRKTENSVLVKVIDFNNNDEEFNEMKYNFKGDPLYSSMISKLCAFNIRSEFIIKLIHNELELNPNQHIIVLAHNRSLLKYFFNSISHHNKHTVGYYVGGMKEEELKKSESNKIILATYSMAAEGLDIKTLTTLVMATPKSDIVQAVGRILRVNHSEPLVIDIVDPHDIFKNQFNKRKSFYKKQKYNMIRSNNNDYFINKWDEITSSKKKTESNNCPFKI